MATAAIQCPVCTKKFRRTEHMKRHRLSHVKEKPFECSDCKRAFHRSDALQRHQVIHTQQGPNLLQRKARACFKCATARARCTAESPQCARCANKNLECAYPESKGSTSAVQKCDMDPLLSTPQDRTTSASTDPTYITSETSQMVNQGFYEPQPSYRPPEEMQISDSNIVIPMSMDIHAPNIPQTHATHDYGYSVEGFGPSSAGGFGFELDGGALSSLNWLPIENSMAYTSTSAVDVPAGWYQSDSIPSGLALQPTNPPPQFVSYSTESSPGPDLQESRSEDQLKHVVSPEALSSQTASSTRNTVTSGEYYLDGDGPRLPKVKRRRIHSKASTSSHQSLLVHFSLELRDRPAPSVGDVGVQEKFRMPEGMYDVLSILFKNTCTLISGPDYISHVFPGIEQWSVFVQLYFEHFHPVLPFLHAETFKTSETPYLLVAAIAAIGSHYAENADEIFSRSMNEFVRRVINLEVETQFLQSISEILFVQARMLNVIGLVYCGDDRLENLGFRHHSELMSYCKSKWIQPYNTSENDENSLDIEDEWRQWVEMESRRRTGYSIWLLDAMWVFQFSQRPILTLSDASCHLPCEEKRWDAPNAAEWHRLTKKHSSSRTLLEALDDMYMENRLQNHTGEFARILIIHGLFRRNWELESYLRQPFARWEPTAHRKGHRMMHATSRPQWMPADQTYSRWRNATCDCLDLLHWRANATIGRRSGMEHPTVLHLHLSRVILLTPFQSILTVAKTQVGKSGDGKKDIGVEKKLIQLWATQDQYKARLAMIHAGVLFWHVRRYSSSAFYEPNAVLLATLALWAYSLFSSQVRPESNLGPRSHVENSGADSDRTIDGEGSYVMSPPSPEAVEQDVEPEDLPIINLDRPADDELVQLFVKYGDSMQAVVTGVGNIYGPNGPKKILEEGRRLLGRLEYWGISRRLIELLIDMTECGSSTEREICIEASDVSGVVDS